MFNYPPRPFFADFIDEFMLTGELHGLGLSTSEDHEVLNYNCQNHQAFDARVLSYLLDRGFVQKSRVDSEQHCFMTFHTSETFCGCSRIYDPILNSWWYSILLSRKPNAQNSGNGNSVFGTIK
jgi:hypothetical protein